MRGKRKAARYLHSLDALHDLAELKAVRFADLDRILYVFDKVHNGAPAT
jgi:hypothetical protein